MVVVVVMVSGGDDCASDGHGDDGYDNPSHGHE